MTTAPVLAVLTLSESFAAVWSELARDRGATLVAGGREDDPPPPTVAGLLAAGGDEERALDLSFRPFRRFRALLHSTICAWPPSPCSLLPPAP